MKFLGMNERVGTRNLVFNFNGMNQDFVPDVIGTRSHSAAWRYFATSIRGEMVFIAYKCDSFIDAVHAEYRRGTKRIPIRDNPIHRRRYFDTVLKAISHKIDHEYYSSLQQQILFLSSKEKTCEERQARRRYYQSGIRSIT